MATNSVTKQSQSTGGSRNRFWSKFRTPPKPTPRRKRGASESTLTTPPHDLLLSYPGTASTVPTMKTTSSRSADELVSPYNYVTDEMTLPEFAQRYQNNLPQQVVVTHGVYWRENMEVNISSSERLNIHFVRHRESVSGGPFVSAQLVSYVCGVWGHWLA